ncbi:hypothetical protein GGR08_001182 [Bartonella fuyuanensis]|uniref:Uncharacterized protein n=1 Tax=Bartonella fuyuanensis TaxID=1460968 RepID=A0A840DV17_9HYPH|nr:hypothetical protein [Bartonella fuyuanensis]MBB4076871.1 hypothetical protein [Bartonella fuyuanensis]
MHANSQDKQGNIIFILSLISISPSFSLALPFPIHLIHTPQAPKTTVKPLKKPLIPHKKRTKHSIKNLYSIIYG